MGDSGVFYDGSETFEHHGMYLLGYILSDFEEDVFPPDLLELMEETYTTGDMTMVARELSGGPPNLAATVASIRDEDGEPLGLVTVVRDITEVKSIQQHMSDFVSMVAHELRSPLGAIAQYLDVILAGVSAEQPEK